MGPPASTKDISRASAPALAKISIASISSSRSIVPMNFAAAAPETMGSSAARAMRDDDDDDDDARFFALGFRLRPRLRSPRSSSRFFAARGSEEGAGAFSDVVVGASFASARARTTRDATTRPRARAASRGERCVVVVVARDKDADAPARARATAPLAGAAEVAMTRGVRRRCGGDGWARGGIADAREATKS